jgi:hypothetical protein
VRVKVIRSMSIRASGSQVDAVFSGRKQEHRKTAPERRADLDDEMLGGVVHGR